MQRSLTSQPIYSVAKKGRYALVVADFNQEITSELENGCRDELLRCGVSPRAIHTVHVPGAFELPLLALRLAQTKKFSAVIALGCIIRGQTPHDRYIAQETARGLGQAALQTGVPILFGVLTPLTLHQAWERAKGKHHKGRESAQAALQMVETLSGFQRSSWA